MRRLEKLRKKVVWAQAALTVAEIDYQAQVVSVYLGAMSLGDVKTLERLRLSLPATMTHEIDVIDKGLMKLRQRAVGLSLVQSEA